MNLQNDIFSEIESRLRDLFSRVSQLESAPTTPSGGGGGSAPANAQYLVNAADAILTNEIVVTAVRGNLIYGNNIPTWATLAHPAIANRILTTDANDVLWSANTLNITGNSTINGSLVGSITGGGTIATGGFTGTIPATANFAMGAGTNSQASINDATIAGHTHATTNTADGDTNPSTILSSDANGGLRLDRLGIGVASSTTGFVDVQDGGGIQDTSGDEQVILDDTTKQVEFWVAGTQRVNITATEISPETDGAIDIGSGTKRFNNTYLVGDVFADGTTDADEALNSRLEDVSGDKVLGNYPYNPLQSIVPVTAWYAGVADGSGRDDFFVDNYAGGTSQWTVYQACTPFSYAATGSWATLASDASTDATPTHAVLRGTISGHASGDRYWWRGVPLTAISVNHRVGLVLMNAAQTTGSAVWVVWDGTSYTVQFDTYSSVNAWLTQANATDSSVGYTTDWTNRYTSSGQFEPFLYPLEFALRNTATLTQLYRGHQPYSPGLQLSSTNAVAFTPAYIYMFVEGNLVGARGIANIDWTGRNIR